MKKRYSTTYILRTLILLFICNITKAQSWEKVWSDEFNYTGLPDSTKWSYNVGGSGWGNHERQFYTSKRPENARVENGMLIIEARKEAWDTMSYTSSRLVSLHKGDWTYGRFEIKARLPKGTGSWPAIWMLPTKWDLGDYSWPDNGEIDIMEHVGFHQNFIHGSTHCHSYYWKNNNQKTGIINIPDASENFHVYALEWTKDSIKTFVDDKLYFTSVNEGTGWKEWPFSKDFYLILNLAIGGDWGGVKGIDNSIFPLRMEVDYVRVYQQQK